MTVDDEIVNPSGNRPFQDILQTRISRRGAMAGGLATTAAGFLATTGVAGAQDGGDAAAPATGGQLGTASAPFIDFTPVAKADAVGPDPTISDDYEMHVVIPWGTPIKDGIPDMGATHQTSAFNQRRQIGIGHDGMWFFADEGRTDKGVLCINHEFGRTSHVLGKDAPESLDDVRIMQAAHGVSCVVLELVDGEWQVDIDDPRNRRIHARTPVEFSGPVAGKKFLRTRRGSSPRGTVNNCASGYTPWGTYLTCEENFNGYFGTDDESWTPSTAQERLGINSGGFGYEWHKFDPRFDVAADGHSRQVNRFGWIVEIDPQDPTAPPVKRTALGRFKHEGIALTEGKNGRVVGYMGDDQRFDYIYKFISADNWQDMIARGESPLDRGVLYVAKFNDDGTGEWLKLNMKVPALKAAFGTKARMLLNTRMAADIVGATPMDRPEWTTVHPDGEVYVTLTNNSRREEPNAANPQAPNANGHIIKIQDRNENIGKTFIWDFFVIADDRAGTPEAFGSPDGVWADDDGRIFIQTDGSQPDGMNDQMLVANPFGHMRRIFAGVNDCEVTGMAVTPDQEWMFINLQHPGNGDPTETNFPVPGQGGPEIPRDATIAIHKRGGGTVGS